MSTIGRDDDYPTQQHSEPPQEKPRSPSTAELEQYKRTVDQVILIWPQFDTINTVDPASLTAPQIQTIHEVLRKLYDQYHDVRLVTRERNDVQRELEELKVACDKLRQSESQLQFENRNLKEDVAILKGELRRRGHNARLPNRSESDTSANGSPRDRLSIPEEEEKPAKLRNSGIYQATPMAKAFGTQEEMKRAVKRNPSKIKEMGGKIGRPTVAVRDRDEEKEELRERIRGLEEELEKKLTEEVGR